LPLLWDDFDIQATVTAVLPDCNVAVLGDQIQTNIALQYHLLKAFTMGVGYQRAPGLSLPTTQIALALPLIDESLGRDFAPMRRWHYIFAVNVCSQVRERDDFARSSPPPMYQRPDSLVPVVKRQFCE
jgi:hypothetical protein